MIRKQSPLHKEEKDGEVKRLKNALRRMERENNQLKAELKTLEVYFKKTQTFVKGYTEDNTVQELISAAKDGKTLKKMKDEQLAEKTCPQCGGDDFKVNTLPFGIMKLCNGCKYVKVEKTKKE
jgi:predicted nuclease with TOPRIM domain